jgi:translocation and assembly module TamB
VLRDLQGLAGGGPAGAPTRPPYFSVDSDPVGGWRLDLTIRGDRFLRIETPLASQRVSADFRLTGRLRSPILTGEARVDSGIVRFPFASLRVTTGRAFITRQQPHQMQHDVDAEGGSAATPIEMHGAGSTENPKSPAPPPLPSNRRNSRADHSGTPAQRGRHGRSQAALPLPGQGLLRDIQGPGDGESLADRLTVESGRELSEEGRETYSIRFDIDDDWALEGGYDVYDQYNIGIRWNVFSK